MQVLISKRYQDTGRKRQIPPRFLTLQGSKLSVEKANIAATFYRSVSTVMHLQSKKTQKNPTTKNQTANKSLGHITNRIVHNTEITSHYFTIIGIPSPGKLCAPALTGKSVFE